MSADPFESAAIVFLLGAGASKPAKVPTTLEFVEEFKGHIAKQDEKLAAPLQRLLEALTLWTGSSGRQADIEALYEVLVRTSETGEDFFVDSYVAAGDAPLSKEVASSLRDELEAFIRTRAFLDPSTDIAYLDPLLAYAEEAAPLELFTTNYDTCLELLCDRHGLRWEDGFSMQWEPEVFKRPGVRVRLRKLHGSVLWYRDDSGNYFRSPLRPETSHAGALRLFKGSCRPLIVYPARKQAFEAPYHDNLTEFRRILENDGKPAFLVAIGYSFRDSHLRQALMDAARRNGLLRVILVDPLANRTYLDRLARVPAKTGVWARSPLQDRVLRMCRPVEKALDEIRRSVLGDYKEAVKGETIGNDVVRRGSNYGWETVLTKYRDCGDIHAFYRLMLSLKNWRFDLDGIKHNPGKALIQLLREGLLQAEGDIPAPEERMFERYLQAAGVAYLGQIEVGADAQGVRVEGAHDAATMSRQLSDLSRRSLGIVTAQGETMFREALSFAVYEATSDLRTLLDGLDNDKRHPPEDHPLMADWPELKAEVAKAQGRQDAAQHMLTAIRAKGGAILRRVAEASERFRTDRVKGPG